MTPKEKATELVNKIYQTARWQKEEDYNPLQQYQRVKQFAIVSVDEILDVLNPEHWGLEMNIAIENLIYWKDVKKEIEKL
jgi:hypothetical protein